MRQVRAERRCYRLTLQHLPSAACTPWSFPPGCLLSVGAAVVSQYGCATPWQVFISNNTDTQFCLDIQWQGERPSLLHYPSFQSTQRSSVRSTLDIGPFSSNKTCLFRVFYITRPHLSQKLLFFFSVFGQKTGYGALKKGMWTKHPEMKAAHIEIT